MIEQERRKRGWMFLQWRPGDRTLRRMGGADDAISMSIELERAYGQAAETDGYRVLVDRLWPQGIAKDARQIDG